MNTEKEAKLKLLGEIERKIDNIFTSIEDEDIKFDFDLCPEYTKGSSAMFLDIKNKIGRKLSEIKSGIIKGG